MQVNPEDIASKGIAGLPSFDVMNKAAEVRAEKEELRI